MSSRRPRKTPQLNYNHLHYFHVAAVEGSVGGAAEYLGVSAASLRNWSDQGKVPVYRTPGGQRRYRVTDLDKFIESWRETPLAAE